MARIRIMVSFNAEDGNFGTAVRVMETSGGDFRVPGRTLEILLAKS
jgi:hypothetical protein